jgi:Sec-independent protein secretion pathway component TatC
MSAVYLKDLRGRLGRFGLAFQMPMVMVTTAEIEDFL